MGMYLESGYLSAEYVLGSGDPFIFIVGARGIGKTFGFLEEALSRYRTTHSKFIYMRRTDAEIEYCASEEGNPFNPLNSLGLCHVSVRTVSKKIRGFFLDDEGEPFGYLLALSNFYSKRSVSFRDVGLMFFDEFIPEVNARPIRNEAEAFFNAVETVARNREIDGGDPLQVVCASNSNTLDNPLFLELNLVSRALKMTEKKIPVYRDQERGFSLIMPFDSPISAKKEKTSLYRLTSKSANFRDMALRNEFADDVSDTVKSMNLRSFSSMIKVGEICIYKHKSDRKYYVSEHESGSFPRIYSSGQMDLRRFRRECYSLWLAYLHRQVFFESYREQLIFEKYFDVT